MLERAMGDVTSCTVWATNVIPKESCTKAPLVELLVEEEEEEEAAEATAADGWYM